VKNIYRTVSGDNAFDGNDLDRMDALNFILDEGACLDPPKMIQRYISALFYYSTEGETWKESGDWVSPNHECDWNGIECNENRIIHQISRDDNTLRGTIPFEICDLPELKKLDLDSNMIGGTIPEDIERCQTLESFDVDNNKLIGPLPDSMFNMENLKSIDLDTNQLTGTLSQRFGSLTNLRYLSVFSNRFDGTIPNRLGLLKQLAIVYVDDNNLTGVVSPQICENLNTLGNGGNLVEVTADCAGANPLVECTCCTNC